MKKDTRFNILKYSKLSSSSCEFSGSITEKATLTNLVQKDLVSHFVVFNCTHENCPKINSCPLRIIIPILIQCKMVLFLHAIYSLVDKFPFPWKFSFFFLNRIVFLKIPKCTQTRKTLINFTNEWQKQVLAIQFLDVIRTEAAKRLVIRFFFIILRLVV